MSHSEYLCYGTRADQLVEECSELILAIQKAKRFGYFARDPLTMQDYDNYMQIVKEMQDVRGAMDRYWDEELDNLPGKGLHVIPMPMRKYGYMEDKT